MGNCRIFSLEVVVGRKYRKYEVETINIGLPILRAHQCGYTEANWFVRLDPIF